jgi:hypothetical protein
VAYFHSGAYIYQSVKLKKKKWTLRRVPENPSGFSDGPYYVSWYDGARKHMDPVRPDPEYALGMLNKKRLELAYIAVVGEIKESPEAQDQNGRRKKVSVAVGEYLAECRDRQGKSGYGLGGRTTEAYTYRLGFLIEFRPQAYLDQVDAQLIRDFRRFLREHPKDLGDRTCYNIIQAFSTFLIRNGNVAAKANRQVQRLPMLKSLCGRWLRSLTLECFSFARSRLSSCARNR